MALWGAAIDLQVCLENLVEAHFSIGTHWGSAWSVCPELKKAEKTGWVGEACQLVAGVKQTVFEPGTSAHPMKNDRDKLKAKISEEPVESVCESGPLYWGCI